MRGLDFFFYVFLAVRIVFCSMWVFGCHRWLWTLSCSESCLWCWDFLVLSFFKFFFCQIFVNVFFCVFWQIFDKFLTNFWQFFDKFLTNFWQILDKFLIHFWQVFDRFLDFSSWCSCWPARNCPTSGGRLLKRSAFFVFCILLEFKLNSEISSYRLGSVIIIDDSELWFCSKACFFHLFFVFFEMVFFFIAK